MIALEVDDEILINRLLERVKIVVELMTLTVKLLKIGLVNITIRQRF